MTTLFAIWLKLILLSTLHISLIKSKIILQENLVPLTLADRQKYTMTTPINFINGGKYNDQNTFKQSNDIMMLLSNNNNQNPSNTPSNTKIVDTLTSIMSQNLNSNLFQRPQQILSSEFHDEESTVYTSRLPLISAFGIQGDSKIMEYVQKKIQSNRKMIFEHNNYHQKPYLLAENKFIIYTPGQFKEMFLTLQEPYDKNYTRNHPPEVSVVLPKSNIRKLQELNINWKTAKKMTSVKYQKQCGACYSFTSIGAIESAFLIKNISLNLAEQQVVDCSTPYDNYGCVGGWTINAYKYIQAFGVLFQSDYPYTAEFGSCAIPSNRPKYWIKNYIQLSNDCNVVIQALKNQPLSIAINADGWQYYSSGVYTDCRQGPSNHGVVLAGVDSNNWLIKNSWGFTWGQSGYMRLSRTAPNAACNVCRWASYPVI